jgi:hypothetical protein
MPITRMIPEKWETVNGKYQKVAEAYPVTIAQGTTLEVGIRSCQIMSDVWGSEKYANYWDDETNKPKSILLDVCDYQYEYGDKVHAEVDATEEVYAKLREWLFNQELARVKDKAEADAQVIHKGDIVEVYKGRNGKGTKGPIVVDIERPYNMGWNSAMRRKFAIATSDRKVKVAAANGKVYENYADVVWTWEHNVRLVNVPAINMNEVTETANELADVYLKTWRQKAEPSRGRLAA